MELDHEAASDYEAALDGQFQARFEAVESGLRDQFGEDAMRRSFIVAGICNRRVSERKLRRDYERELTAWELELRHRD